MRIKLNRLFKKKSMLLSVIVLTAFLVFLTSCPVNGSPSQSSVIGYDYYEDTTGTLSFSELPSIFSDQPTKHNPTGSFLFGNSRSTFWIRIPLKELTSAEREGTLFIYNPTVAKAILYLPVKNGATTSYETLSSGWLFGVHKQDDHFVYPTFTLNQNTDFSQDAYLQLSSPFTQNYSLELLSPLQTAQTKDGLLLLNGLLFGIFLAVALLNLFTFFELTERVYLDYFFYILIMSIYQGCLLGIYNVFVPDYAPFLMPNTIFFSLLTMLMSIVFFRSFFSTKVLFPAYEKWAKGLMTAVFVGIILPLFSPSSVVNLYAHSLSVIGGLSLLSMAIGAFRRGFHQARFFIIGWLFVIIGVGISFCRNAGWIANTVVTINITFVAMAINSIFLSTALIQRVKQLMNEKEAALKQSYEAEELAQSRELAFLQAQIKPHFLFNALNIIASLCRIDPVKARKLLLDLSEYLHHSFDFYPDQKLVPLSTELNGVQAFVRIEQARFPDSLEVIYDLDDRNLPMIPPLTLQPLVENAILHGIRKKSTCGTIILRTVWTGDGFRFFVEDDGVGMTAEQVDDALLSEWHPGKGVGLSNIHKRLLAMYGQGLLITSVPGEKTSVSFWIKKGD
ncbi:7TM diverse intracellular signaling domain-containing protein [Acetobacterium wieringae]|uniref:7TM diverse intracellular signaling domain-containing protein n=1 Tax=Acetobacterium wieringae TaxID=52694 RepID=UPI002B1F792D|nr:7TM diverse intracellular signaling domain-containing protein [Acetobacterium wieringae]MEA4804768.1 7TM diverse intracellular signaling domain-containing protein [Acetobacterium wieringae]